MTRRVFVAMVGVTILAVVLFAVPLAVVLSKIYRDQHVLVLQRDATVAAINIPDDRRNGEVIALPSPPEGGQIAFYGTDGALVAGAGPQRSDDPTGAALAGRTGDDNSDDALIVAVPVSDDQRVIGAVRIAEPAARRPASCALHTYVSRRSRSPPSGCQPWSRSCWLDGSRDRGVCWKTARKLGDGDFTVRSEPTGIDEVDRASRALDETSDRLAALIERERRFAADASHQLRTPLTALQVVLEAELTRPRDDPTIAVQAALTEAGRLDATIESLLDAARDDPRQRHPLDVGALLHDAVTTHREAAAVSGRSIDIDVEENLASPTASETVIRHILDVLVDNAVRHGSGSITVAGHDVAGAGVVLSVTDQGQVLDNADAVFDRRSPSANGHGIGLALALDLADAEGGRLRLSKDTSTETTFELLLPTTAAP